MAAMSGFGKRAGARLAADPPLRSSGNERKTIVWGLKPIYLVRRNVEEKIVERADLVARCLSAVCNRVPRALRYQWLIGPNPKND